MSHWTSRLATDARLKLGEAQRKEMARAAADRAIASLGKALDKGFKDVARFKRQHAFAVLRDRDDFKRSFVNWSPSKNPDRICRKATEEPCTKLTR